MTPPADIEGIVKPATDAEIERVRIAYDALIRARWSVVDIPVPQGEADCVVINGSSPDIVEIARMSNGFRRQWTERIETAAAIVGLHNAFPSIIARIEAEKARADAYRAVAVRMAGHAEANMHCAICARNWRTGHAEDCEVADLRALEGEMK